MTWGFVAIGGATLGAALISNDSSTSAANKQQAATQAGINTQSQQFDLSRADTAPYRDTGSTALANLRASLGLSRGPSTAATGAISREDFDGAAYLAANPDIGKLGKDAHFLQDPYAHYLEFGQKEGRQGFQYGQQTADQNAPLTRKFSISDFWNDPVVQASYQSGLDLGTKALKNAAPLTTGLDSGAAMKELTKFGTDYTGNMAAGSQARFVGDQTNQFNHLASMAGIGQTAVAQSGAAGANSANNISQMLTANGNAQGAAKIAGANAFGGGINSVANYWQQQQMLSRLPPQGGTPTTGYTPAQNPDWYAG